MPIYEYRCPNGHLTEKLESINSDNKTTECKKCGEKADKVYSTSNCHMAGMVGGCVKNW